MKFFKKMLNSARIPHPACLLAFVTCCFISGPIFYFLLWDYQLNLLIAPEAACITQGQRANTTQVYPPLTRTAKEILMMHPIPSNV
ncbi:hypothetical protein Y032_0051g2171 [Ancylostoma ceylanicum]|uniref:Uncharacterized protein n=1 Tax=Ancylostoma ceylanicum TaxID=53326 RepID=A0A016U8U5_9BILA|nr:hypothetical protein Y032_0051g2171 [Ancylostoma ceylanicum]